MATVITYQNQIDEEVIEGKRGFPGPPGAGGTGGTSDHALLTHLTYAAAGHTGFLPDTHTSTYNHVNYDTAYGWGNHAGLYLPAPLAVTTNHYTGFPNRIDTTLAFVAGALGATRTLTLAGTNFDIYVDGIKYTVATDLTKQIADVTGLYWFWISISLGSPVLNGATSGQTFGSCLVATVYWNTTINKGIISDERHWMGRDKWMHEYLHETMGARFHAGMAITPTDTTFAIDEGEFYDEDIEHVLSAATTVGILYKNGSANWEWDTAQVLPYKLNTNSMRWNDGNNLADVDTNRFAAMWIFATNNIMDPFISIIGQRVDITIAAARTNNTPNSLTLGTLPGPEMKLLYRLIFKQNVTSVTYMEAADYRTVSNAPIDNYTATDHSSLSNLTYAAAGHSGFLPDTHLTDFTHANIATAYGWGDHAGAGYAPLANPVFTGVINVSYPDNNNPGLIFYKAADGSSYPYGGIGAYNSDSTNAGLSIYTVNAGAYRRSMTFHHDGQIGINTATPDATLQVAHTNGAGCRINYAAAGDNYFDGTTNWFRGASGGANGVIKCNGDIIAYAT